MGVKRNEVTKSFAQWTERTHFSVTFDPGANGKITGNNVIDRYDGQTMTNAEVPVVTPNNHYIFKGWNPEFIEHAVTSNETYTAVYEYVAATVHFNTNGGESINDIEVDRGSKVDNTNTPRHKDGVFAGWYRDSELQNAVDLSTWKMPTPAVETTFYAKWDMNAAKVIISFNITGGSVKSPTLVKVLQIDGWANVKGQTTLTSDDIKVTVSHGYDPDTLKWTPKEPVAGMVITENTTFTGVFEKLPIFNINVALGSNIRFIKGASTQSVIKGESVDIEIGPTSRIYTFGKTPDECQKWLTNIVIDPPDSLQITVKSNSHVPPTTTIIDSSKAVEFADSISFSGVVNGDISITTPDAIETPLTINFVDPGNGGTGVAKFNPDSRKVDNSDIGKRTITSRSIYRSSTESFTTDIFEQEKTESADYVYPLDENGIVVGFQNVEGMTPLALYDDIGIEKDHIEKFNLDLSHYYNVDSLDIVCDMLRFDYYLTELRTTAELLNESQSNLSNMVIAINDDTVSDAYLHYWDLSRVPKAIVYRCRKDSTFEDHSYMFTGLDPTRDTYNLVTFTNETYENEPNIPMRIPVHNDLFRYLKNRLDITATIGTVEHSKGVDDKKIILDLEEFLSIYKYQRHTYKVLSFTTLKHQGNISGTMTPELAKKCIAEFKRLIKDAVFINPMIVIDYDRNSSTSSKFENDLNRTEISLAGVYDEAKNIKNFCLPFKYDYYVMPDDLLKNNTKIKSLYCALRFMHFGNKVIPNIFQNKKISSLERMFQGANYGTLQPNAITVIIDDEHVSTPWREWLNPLSWYDGVIKLSENCINLELDPSLSEDVLSKKIFDFEHLFEGCTSTTASMKAVRVTESLTNKKFQLFVRGMIYRANFTATELDTFADYTLSKLPPLTSFRYAYEGFEGHEMSTKYNSSCDKNITALEDVCQSSKLWYVNDDIIARYPNVTSVARFFTWCSPMKRVPEWWIKYADRITDSTNCFDCNCAENYYHIPVSWGGPADFTGYYGSGKSIELTCDDPAFKFNKSATEVSGTVTATLVRSAMNDDQLFPTLKANILKKDEIVVAQSDTSYGSQFTIGDPTWDDAKSAILYPIKIVFPNNAPNAGDNVAFTFDWRKEHKDFTFVMPKKYNIQITLGTHMSLTSGSLTQTIGDGHEMDEIIITCDNEWMFDESWINFGVVTGLTATLSQDKKVATIKGTPKSDVNLTIPDALIAHNATLVFRFKSLSRYMCQVEGVDPNTDNVSIELRTADTTVNGDKGGHNFTDGVCLLPSKPWAIGGDAWLYDETITGLPACRYDATIKLPSYYPAYVKDYFTLTPDKTTGLINNQTVTDELVSTYPTGNLKVHTYNACNTERSIAVTLFYPDGKIFDGKDTFGAANYNGTGVSDGVIGAMIENTFTLERIPVGFKYKVTLDNTAYDPSKITLTSSNTEGIIDDGTEITADFRCIEVVGDFNFNVLIITPPDGGWSIESTNFVSFTTIIRFNQPIPQDIANTYEVSIYREDPTSGSTITGTLDLSSSAGYSGIQYGDQMILPSSGLNQNSYFIYKVSLVNKNNESDVKHTATFHVPTPPGSTEQVTLKPISSTRTTTVHQASPTHITESSAASIRRNITTSNSNVIPKTIKRVEFLDAVGITTNTGVNYDAVYEGYDKPEASKTISVTAINKNGKTRGLTTDEMTDVVSRMFSKLNQMPNKLYDSNSVKLVNYTKTSVNSSAGQNTYDVVVNIPLKQGVTKGVYSQPLMNILNLNDRTRDVDSDHILKFEVKVHSGGGGGNRPHHGGTADLSPGNQESPGSGISVRGMSIPIRDENFVDIPLSGLVDEHGNKYPDFTLRFKLVKQDFENRVNTFWNGYIELPDGILDAIRKARVSPDSADEFYLNVMISYYRSDITNNQEPKHLIRESKFDLSTNETCNIINSVLGTPGESYDKMNIVVTDVIITDEW